MRLYKIILCNSALMQFINCKMFLRNKCMYIDMTNENIHITYSTTAVPMLNENTLY